jgi:hypothetical protein
MRAAQNAHALLNALQAKSDAPLRFFIWHKAAPVVTDRELQLASVYRQVERPLLAPECFRMLLRHSCTMR